MPPHYVDIDSNTRLYHGDARDVLPLLDGHDAVITDPPYGDGFGMQPLRYQRANGMAPSKWDSAPISPELMAATIAAGRVAIVWGGNYYALPPSRCWLAWVKAGNAPSMADMELAWTNADANARVFHKTVKSASLEKDLQRWPHPSVKPVDLMRWCIVRADGFHPSGYVRSIVDPFMGTGTTGVAAATMGRRFVGIERDLRYFQYAVERITEAKKQADMFGYAMHMEPPEQIGLSL